MNSVVIIDNSPAAYMMQPENALPISSWYNDPRDTELSKLIPILEKFTIIEDVRNYIRYLVIGNRILFTRAHTMMNAAVQRSINKSNRIITQDDN